MLNSDTLRIAIVSFAFIVFAINFFAPIFGTVIPYKKKMGKGSWTMRSRLILRSSFLFLAIHNILPPVIRTINSDALTPELLVEMSEWGTVLYFIIALAMLHMWWRHPDGVKGL